MPERRAPEMTREEWRQYRHLLHTHPEQYLRIAEETIHNFPDDTRGYEDCADYHVEVEQYDEALRYLDKALGMDPTDMLIPFKRGTVHLRAGRYQDALQAFDPCIRDWRWSRDGTLNACLATCHAYGGDMEAALAECAKIGDDYFLPDVYGQFGGTKAQIIETVQRVARGKPRNDLE